MKVLFLDDNLQRRITAKSFFSDCHIVIVETAEQAIEAIDKHSPFDVVYLDHDLGGQVFVPSDEKSGFSVAQHLAKLNKKKLPTKVVIHSFNPVGAKKMYDELKPIIDQTYIEPFNLNV